MSDHSHTPAPTEHADAKAHSHDEHAPHSLKPYYMVGGALFVFTLITVALSYCDFDKWFHGHGLNMKIGLAVANFKVCLVGAYFMHLKDEKSTIWKPLLFTFFFCFALFALFMLAHGDPIPTSSFPVH